MTEKRFVNIGNEIHLNGEWWCSANGEHCADVITTALNELSEQAEAVRTELQLCEEENNALQERNDRQAETIRKLYTWIGNKDWKALATYMEELEKCEEQLQYEWRTYSG